MSSGMWITQCILGMIEASGQSLLKRVWCSSMRTRKYGTSSFLMAGAVQSWTIFHKVRRQCHSSISTSTLSPINIGRKRKRHHIWDAVTFKRKKNTENSCLHLSQLLPCKPLFQLINFRSIKRITMPNQLSRWSFKLTSLLMNKDWSHCINVITEDYFTDFKFDAISTSTV